MAICVLGEGLVDLVPVSPGSLQNYTPALGGGPYNVAIAASRLGAEVIFQSRLSTDGFGAELVANLLAEGINIDYLERGDEPTIIAITTIARDGSAQDSFYTEGTATAFLKPTLIDANIACFGTLSLAMAPGAQRLAAILRKFSQQGTLVALDPNIRPFYATSDHRNFLLELLPEVHLLKLSDEEVDFLGEEALSQVPVAVITRGADGLTVVQGAQRWDVAGVSTTVADTIGAGDTVMGALLARLDALNISASTLSELNEGQWREIANYAARAAAITVSRKGAQPPHAADLSA